MAAPRLFISYSWTSQEHELRVIDLATRLREVGVDVILDKWDLKEGHDAIAFMEQMVTDPTIEKVAIISDKKYAEKADGRRSGVGTETQIISREVYERQDQNKFVAVVTELDDQGKPWLPTFYKGRIYIDLSSPEHYAAEFERLVRWVFNKPLHVKPELGSAPSFLNDEPATSLGTSLAFRRSLDALRNGKPFVEGAVDEYLTIFAENLERFRIVLDPAAGHLDDQIAASVEEFAPYKNEFVQAVLGIAQYAANADMAKKLHRFFEQLLPYMDRPENMHSHHPWAFDNFKFIVHELFLYTIAILIRYERFDLVNQILGTPYYVSARAERGRSATMDFSDFRSYMESFEARSRRLRRLSSRADLLKERAESSGFDFKSLMQADLVLFIRAKLINERWWPETMLYAIHSWGPMEIFARSRSASYFDRARRVLGGSSVDELKALVDRLGQSLPEIPQWGHERLSIATLIDYDKLASIP